MKSRIEKSVEQINKMVDQKHSKGTVVVSSRDVENFKKQLGTDSQKMAMHLITQLASIVHKRGDADPAEAVALGLALQNAIQPKDELESLLASQMVGAHHLAMEFMGRALQSCQPVEQVSANVERATKLMRTFTAQMEALNRHRGKGQQKVTVEHVTVNQGGQAVIGNVENPGGSGGDNVRK
jgi:hypothetical protein